MKVFRVPERCGAIIFDVDSTLYTHPEYARSQIDLPIDRLARLKETTFDAMYAEIEKFKKNWAVKHGGRQISLGNTFTHFGVSIDESVKWREELCRPEQYLTPDVQLRSVLEKLQSKFALAIVTNNPVSVAARTLSALGVGDMFRAVVGLDTCGVSKPHEDPFLRAAVLCGTVTEACVSVGDRYEIDIALPLELGMGGILVDGVEDVYNLPEILFTGGG
jgi:phosphoglycolate phosphatase/putative hydrolase of the HAD superfamily